MHEIPGKKEQIFLHVFGSFLYIYIFISLTPEYKYSDPEDEVCFNDQFRNPVFGPFKTLFIIDPNSHQVENRNVLTTHISLGIMEG